MKLKPLIATSILCVCALCSCKKNSSNNSTNNPNKLKLYIEDLSQTPANEIDTFTVTYDADNRITALTGSKVRTVYTYSSNSSFTLDLYDMNVLSIHEILFLNNQSYIDSTFQYNNTNDTTTEKYTYTGSLLTDLTTYDYTTSGGAQFDTEDEYQYDNGNVTKDTQTDQYGNVTVTTAVYGSQLLNFSINPSYYPLHSKNIPINETVTDGFGNTEAGISYAYTFDGSGRITKQSAFDSISGYTLSKIFVYY